MLAKITMYIVTVYMYYTSYSKRKDITKICSTSKYSSNLLIDDTNENHVITGKHELLRLSVLK